MEHLHSFYIGKEYYKYDNKNTFYHGSLKNPGVFYKTNPDAWFCTCKGYIYSKYPMKKCRHLINISKYFNIYNEIPKFLIIKTDTIPQFQPVSNIIPKNINSFSNWCYSIKYDGIRVCVYPNGNVVTKSGLRLIKVEHLISTTNSFPIRNATLDCELCIPKHSNHREVFNMFLHTRSVHPQNKFILRIIDIIPNNDESMTMKLSQRYLWILNQHIPPPFSVIKRINIPINFKLEDISSTILQPLLTQSHEGIVLSYFDSLHSTVPTNQICFKMKKLMLPNILDI